MKAIYFGLLMALSPAAFAQDDVTASGIAAEEILLASETELDWIEETQVFGRRCRDSRDCLWGTEHCVRGVCEPKVWGCYNSFDCVFPERCINRVCQYP